MRHTISLNGSNLTLCLEGSMHTKDATVLRNCILNYLLNGHSTFVISLAKLDYVDATGLGVLVGMHKRAICQGGNLTVTGINGKIQDIFNLTRMNKILAQ